MKRHSAFTLIELMVVILIVGILAGVTIPTLRGKVDEAKWTEAKAATGMIRRAVKTYHFETGNIIKGRLNRKKVQDALNIQPEEISGVYFAAKNYRIMNIDSEGNARIRIKGTQKNAPKGTKFLEIDGSWN